MTRPIEPHYDGLRKRWFMIWCEGNRKGQRVDWMDPEFQTLDGYFTPQACGADDEFIMECDPLTGKRVECIDYSLRFYTEEGAQFFIYQIVEWAKVKNKFLQKLSSKRAEMLGL